MSAGPVTGTLTITTFQPFPFYAQTLTTRDGGAQGGGSASSVTTKHYLLDGLPVAVRRDGVFAYLYHDHLHGVLQATDPTGLDLGVRTYSAFGAARRSNGDLLTVSSAMRNVCKTAI